MLKIQVLSNKEYQHFPEKCIADLPQCATRGNLSGRVARHGVIRINRFSHCLAGKEMQQEQQLSNKKRMPSRHRFRIVLYVTLCIF